MITIKGHIVSALVACCILLSGVIGYDRIKIAFINPDTFMKVSVSVPDHNQGEDQTVSYIRDIYREMRGKWVVEIRRIGSNDGKCSGSGESLYSPSESRNLPLSLSEYVGIDCKLKPGKYFMVTRWDLTDSKNNSAIVENVTEPFIVFSN